LSQTDIRTPLGPVPVQGYGKYYLISKLAEGGMAEIFLAKQVGVEGFEKNVVVKRMLSHLSAVPDFVSMFLDEARLASRLAHPNVVQILDLGFEAGCYFIAMEYLAGEDFSTVIRSAAKRRAYVPLNIALKVVADAAHGLHYAHEFTDSKGQPLNVVHRDVSPSNIFVTYSGQVKMLDFGIAKAESRITTTTAGVVKGKYQYMSPEQAQSAPVDRRADVYSLGVCLYEALCNARPFARDSDLAILNAVLKNEYKPPRQVRPDLPVELEQIIVRALARTPEERFQSAGELAGALENYLRASTSVTSGVAITQYMTSFFGPERVAAKTRIDSLDDMKARGVPLPPLDMSPFPLVTPSGPSLHIPGAPAPPPLDVLVEDSTAAIGVPKSVTALRRRTMWLGGVGVVSTIALIAGIITLVSSLSSTKVGSVDPVDPPPKVAPVPPEHDAGVNDANTVVVGPADAGPPAPVDAGLPKKVPTDTPPVTLTSQIIRQIIVRNLGRLQKCFEQYSSEIPPTGTVPVTITIERSGRVRESSAPAGPQLSRCLEEYLLTIRFPRHVDEAVTITLPLTPSKK
jgi:serine/threonine-protein kinase